MADPNCLFCKLVAGEIPSEKVFENKDILAFPDINPQAPVHILIIPKEHVPTVADFSEGQTGLAGQMVQAANQIAKKKGLESGFRLVFNCQKDAGQEVFHVHLHLLGGRKFTWPPG